MKTIKEFKNFSKFNEGRLLPTLKPSKNAKEDPKLVDSIKDICQELIDSNFKFSCDFKSSDNSYEFLLLSKKASDFGGISIYPINWEKSKHKEDDVEEEFNELSEYIDNREQASKSLIKNIPEINDRLDDFKNEWYIEITLNAILIHDKYLKIKMWK